MYSMATRESFSLLMDSEDIKRVSALYSSRYKDEAQPSHKKVGWGSAESQELRFSVLSQIGISGTDSILDVGCGLGDFYLYLRSKGHQPTRYVGIDICEDFVLHCRSHLDSDRTRFLTGTLDQQGRELTADFVVLSGSLNLKLRNNYDVARETLKEMMVRAHKGVAANFLTSYVDFMHDKDFHYSPEQIFKMCRQIASKVVLRHDYPLYEFTVYLYV